MSAPRAHVPAGAAGVTFGVGLAVAQMIDPHKILAFLDVAGAWDPSLAFVMGAALAVTGLGYRWLLRRERPALAARFYLPTRTEPDPRLFAGAAVFGVGWGLGGYCPGPALAALAAGSAEPLVFVASMIAGSFAWGALDTRWSAGRSRV